jgi:hypothetical protein
VARAVVFGTDLCDRGLKSARIRIAIVDYGHRNAHNVLLDPTSLYSGD